jgi:hypothetical protein
MTWLAPLLALAGVLAYSIPGWLTKLPPSLLARPYHSWALIGPAVVLGLWRMLKHRTTWTITAFAWTVLFAAGFLYGTVVFTRHMPAAPRDLLANGAPSPTCALDDATVPGKERTLVVFHRGRW